jgi:cbb3-type cytochrome oxidase subunit 3
MIRYTVDIGMDFIIFIPVIVFWMFLRAAKRKQERELLLLQMRFEHPVEYAQFEAQEAAENRQANGALLITFLILVLLGSTVYVFDRSFYSDGGIFHSFFSFFVQR